jgi:transposase-like protein
MRWPECRTEPTNRSGFEVNELTAEYGVHATQLNTWRKQALAAIPEAFSDQRGKAEEDRQAEIDELHRQIGQLIAEREWLKKNPRDSRFNRLSGPSVLLGEGGWLAGVREISGSVGWRDDVREAQGRSLR